MIDPLAVTQNPRAWRLIEREEWQLSPFMQDRTAKRSELKRVNLPEPDHGSEGVLILDDAFRPIALDCGAETILRNLSSPNWSPDENFTLPKEIRNALDGPSEGDPHGVSRRISVGNREYVCRVFRMTLRSDAGVQPVKALYLRREQSIADAVLHAGADYHLTDREQQALIGMTMGLTSKELAEQMKISPNTVKAYLRLIMIKMGVTTRAGIVGKLLDQNNRSSGVGT